MDLIQYLLVFGSSFFVVLLSTPALIRVAILKRLFDEPTEDRKLHKRVIPTIGGIIIFAGTFLAFAFWLPTTDLLSFDTSVPMDNIRNTAAIESTRNALNDFKYILSTVLIMFFVGVKDDIIGTAPIKKLAAHVLCGLIIVLMADIRLKGLHGIFGVLDIPYEASIFLSLFTIIVIINAFNLIDGIDGLAAGVGFIASFAFGVWFVLAGELVMSLLAFSLAGSLLGFLFFNFAPAKIFMGDSGSLTIGLMIAVMAIKLIEFNKAEIQNDYIDNISKPIFTMACLVYPLLDTLRIFIYRLSKGISPFSADKNHIHHRLLAIGLNHGQAAVVLYGCNILVIACCLFVRHLDPSWQFAIVGGSAVMLAQVPFFIRKKRHKA